MPSFVEALIPLLVVVALCPILQFGFSFESTPATVIAQTVAMVVCLLLNIRRGFSQASGQDPDQRLRSVCGALLMVCAIVATPP